MAALELQQSDVTADREQVLSVLTRWGSIEGSAPQLRPACARTDEVEGPESRQVKREERNSHNLGYDAMSVRVMSKMIM
ncbi:hypothetical protein AXG93_885s1060 [Marchantia polymorpha subsp. ruderalis]|uniref:Uncharacterized protein n=1 Tax=Marchantia polymorpha subsp. ruderalis TaxID=1480154 RepID=A0A176WFL6_MARPO|nr:hypothetical protein AXG93_885s1060 [Marchantia polymorpha subsp. ruderalis]